MGVLGKTFWDQVEARRLYDALVPLTAIARAVGTTSSQVGTFAARHWPNRDKTAVVQAPRVNAHPERQAARKAARGRRLAPGQSTLAPLPSLADDGGAC